MQLADIVADMQALRGQITSLAGPKRSEPFPPS
jgi:hypothetical protein